MDIARLVDETIPRIKNEKSPNKCDCDEDARRIEVHHCSGCGRPTLCQHLAGQAFVV